MQDMIKTMRERICKLEDKKRLKASEIESLVAEWKRIAQSIYNAICDDGYLEYFDDEDNLIELANEIQELKDSLKTLTEEITEAKVLDEWYVGESFVSAIEYDDFSGLDNEEEIADVQNFVNKIAGYSPDFCLVWGEESGFERCHISGLRDNCLLAKMVLMG